MALAVMNPRSETVLNTAEHPRKISLTGYPDVAGLFCVTVFKNTLELDVTDCSGLLTLDGVRKCIELRKLSIVGCGMLTNISDLKECQSLETLYLSECKTLRNMAPLKGHRTLTSLTIVGCERVAELDLDGVTNLTVLSVVGCDNLGEVCVGRCTRLRAVDIRDCGKLVKLSGLTYLGELEALVLAGCKELTAVEGINELINKMKKLSLKNCEKLEDLKFLDCCTFLSEIVIAGSNVTEEKKMELKGRGVKIVNELKDLGGTA